MCVCGGGRITIPASLYSQQERLSNYHSERGLLRRIPTSLLQRQELEQHYSHTIWGSESRLSKVMLICPRQLSWQGTQVTWNKAHRTPVPKLTVLVPWVFFVERDFNLKKYLLLFSGNILYLPTQPMSRRKREYKNMVWVGGEPWANGSPSAILIMQWSLQI